MDCPPRQVHSGPLLCFLALGGPSHEFSAKGPELQAENSRTLTGRPTFRCNVGTEDVQNLLVVLR